MPSSPHPRSQRPALRYGHAELVRFTEGVLRSLGMPGGDAALGARVLLDADLAGVDTHGIANLVGHAHYVPGLRDGHVAARPEVAVLRESPVSAAWDSGRGFGPVVAHRAMSAAIAKAEEAGIGMVTVREGRHFGANGHFAEMAATRGLVGMATATTPPAAFPPGGRRRAVGTNPLGFAAPVADGPPLVVDLAMTAVSGSRVSAARRAGAAVPEGWVVDAEGRPSTDPSANREGGALELLGGGVAGHKGFALALVVDVLGVLAGNGPAAQQDLASWSQGQWFAAWRTDLFVDEDEFQQDLRSLVDDLHDVPAAHAPVRVPGERRAATRAERTRSGVPLRDDVAAGLRVLGEELGLRFPSATAE